MFHCLSVRITECRMLSKLLPHLLIVGFFIGSVFFAYNTGYTAGQNATQILWDKEKKEQKEAIQKTELAFKEAEKSYLITIGKLNDEIKVSKETYQNELNSIESEFALRLQQSDKRASIYQRQAQGGASECRSLANHAARLDSTLEEGRAVVRELSEVVRLRDRELVLLSKQILADRSLATF